jgi:hypothetical protein
MTGRFLIGFGVAAVLMLPSRGGAEMPAGALRIFNSYIDAIEARLGEQHRSRDGFLAGEAADPQSEMRLRRGEVIVEMLTPPVGAELPGALLHHWRGTAFAAGARAEDFERLLRDFNGYPKYFSPQVIEARLIAQDGDEVQGWMRVRERHVMTVVMDSTYDVRFGRLDAQHGYSVSRSTRIAEVNSATAGGAGTSAERALGPSEDHGFLWRMNTYWSWEERDGGLYVQVESVSLTRSIPRGLGWAVGPFVESIPRESLEFTQRAACDAVRDAGVQRAAEQRKEPAGERTR